MRKTRAGVDDLGISEKLLALLYVKGLPPGQAAVRLSAIGFSNPQIASVLGKSANAVKKLVQRGRRKEE